MKVRWLGVGLVVLLVLCTLLLKNRMKHTVSPVSVSRTPAVVLIADPREANEPADACAVIFHAVREASKRGVDVEELPPDSNSDLLRRYHVLTIPTVLLFDKTGKEVGRFEGEDDATVKAIQMRLASLSGGNR